ncbi:MAG: 2'-5' RNA ligase family protein [Chitinophagaceae bacterium]
MAKSKRQQLTLFVEEKDSEEIERIRKRFNPVQRALIDCHVTICREDEIRTIDKVLDNLSTPGRQKVTIQFGQIVMFDNGKGVLIPATNDNCAFYQLRKSILKGSEIYSTRRHEPHITLMHPRNATCTDEIFKTLKKANLPTHLTFKTVSLIEQVDGGQWQILKIFRLE